MVISRMKAVLLAFVLVAGLLSYSAVTNQSAWLTFGETTVAAGSCPDYMIKTVRYPLWTPETAIVGPARGEAWWNNNAKNANRAHNPGFQPPWNQDLIKFRLDVGEVLLLNGASVVARQVKDNYRHRFSCSKRILAEHRARDLPNKSPKKIANEGMGHFIPSTR